MLNLMQIIIVMNVLFSSVLVRQLATVEGDTFYPLVTGFICESERTNQERSKLMSRDRRV